MKNVKVNAVVAGINADDIYVSLSGFEKYPKICSAIRAVSVEWEAKDQLISYWEVNFNSGILKWAERDILVPSERRISFQQVNGDIDLFTGCWQVTPHTDGSHISFNADFDLGIPMLEDMLEPIAADAITGNVRQIIESLFVSTDVEFM
jgi:ribosome-associated toxin RatA of RatAB toxin-antitoxin module